MFHGFNSFFGGGRGGMEEDEDEPQSKEIDNKSLYQLLDLPPGAATSTDDVKKSFRKKAVREHPDKGGDPDKFRKLTEAYEILSNPEKKELYDKYGMEGVKNGGGGGAGDLFDLFGFGGGRGQKDKGPQKMKGRLVEMQVTLEDIYEGKMVKLPIKRKRCCEKCDGKGGSNVKTCPTCKGKRIIQKLVMLGPGMYSQTQGPCQDCRGEGQKMNEKDKCPICKGEKVKEAEKIIEVPLEKGVPDEHDYIFYGESDELPGVMAGDLYVRIKTKKHQLYQRKGADLYLKHKITLLEALTGVQITLPFLDGSLLSIYTGPGEIIGPNEIKTVKNKGMSFYKDAMSHGNLHIEFEVEFPKPRSFKENQITQLKQVLSGPKKQENQKFDEKKVSYLEDFDETELNTNAEGGKQKDEDEEDDHQRGGGGQRVQCAQQ